MPLRAPSWRPHSVVGTILLLLAPAVGAAGAVPAVPGPTAPLLPEMVEVPAGCFVMGSPPDERGRDDDEHLHRICLDRFAIGRHEVTFAQFDRFARAVGRLLPDDGGWGRTGRPVVAVPWDDATDFARWMSERTGRRFRLPTEAEWEYAARAGGRGPYPWGDESGHGRANCDGCGGPWGGRSTAPVGSFAANRWGLHDTVGNVWEWTCSGFASGYRRREVGCKRRLEPGPRAIRGGSWANRPSRVRAASRDWTDPYARYLNLGFRVAEDPQAGPAGGRETGLRRDR